MNLSASAQFGITAKLKPYDEISQFFTDEETTLGDLKEQVIASSDLSVTETSELKAFVSPRWKHDFLRSFTVPQMLRAAARASTAAPARAHAA